MRDFAARGFVFVASDRNFTQTVILTCRIRSENVVMQSEPGAVSMVLVPSTHLQTYCKYIGGGRLVAVIIHILVVIIYAKVGSWAPRALFFLRWRASGEDGHGSTSSPYSTRQGGLCGASTKSLSPRTP